MPGFMNRGEFWTVMGVGGAIFAVVMLMWTELGNDIDANTKAITEGFGSIRVTQTEGFASIRVDQAEFEAEVAKEVAKLRAEYYKNKHSIPIAEGSGGWSQPSITLPPTGEEHES